MQNKKKGKAIKKEKKNKSHNKVKKFSKNGMFYCIVRACGKRRGED
jgi:hypothetical protein